MQNGYYTQSERIVNGQREKSYIHIPLFHCNQLKNNISKSPYISAEQAVKLYEKLDLTLSAYLASKKEVKS